MNQATAPVQGDCASRFERLKQVFAKHLVEGADLGASLAVTIDGEFVVDLCGGWADETRTRPWNVDTLAHVYSTTKMMTSLAALLLVDRGELDLDAPVARYWPEFAAAGKGRVRLRHVLSHTSGVCGWEQRLSMLDLCDREKSTTLLAAQAPWWEPGTASGYHMLNYGHLISEIIRRVTGLTLPAFFAQEIARPLGADFHIGIGPAEFGRLATNVLPPPRDLSEFQLPPESIAFRTIHNPMPDPSIWTNPTYRQADIGASNGYGNAHSAARVLSIIAGGGEARDTRLLSEKTVDRIFEPQMQGIDLVLGIPLNWGVGYGLPAPHTLTVIPDESKICFWGGFGGSMTVIDAGRRMTISYVMNKLAPGIIGGPNAAALLTSAYACLNES